MNLEFALIATADGLRLPAGFFAGRGPNQSSWVDAALFSTGAFYQPFVTAPAMALAEVGIPVLTLSNRGYDLVLSGMGNRVIGTAFERVSDCHFDFSAAIDWLTDRGYRRIALIGHSIVGLKALYYAAHAPRPALCGVISSAGPRLSATLFRSSQWAAQFAANEQTAQTMAQAGRGDDLFPMTFPSGGPVWISAAAYLDKYCGERYDPLAWGHQIGVPVLRIDPDGDLAPGTLNGMLMGGLAEALLGVLPSHERTRAVVIPNADHAYTSGQPEFITTLRDWLLG